MNKDLKELLEDIKDWMIDNDYECGERGGDIYTRVDQVLEQLENHERMLAADAQKPRHDPFDNSKRFNEDQ